MLSKNQIKEIQSLHLKKQRDLRKCFIAEGAKTINEILDENPRLIVEVFGGNDFILKNNDRLAAAGITGTPVTDEELRKISMQSTPGGALAICRYLPAQKGEADLNAYFSFYLDDIRDPGNFGTIIRLADWFGLDTLYCSPNTCEIYNPKVIQSTMGAFLRVKVEYVELTDLVKRTEIKNIYGANLSGADLYREKLKGGLIVLGNEANGIRQENMSFVNKAITIPSHQTSGTESLNAAMAGAIIASEFFRQLGAKQI